MGLSPGTTLGAHEIVGLLGAGGMGEVYRARDTKLNRQVAIKVLPDASAADPERVARFQREALAVAALNHPNIGAIHDFAESGSTKYLVLELIEGETLAERLRRGAVPPDEALGIIKQVLEALEAAHDRGICHRDLKPANIKITADGMVKVLDFGLAKFMQSSPAAASVTNSPTLSVAGTIPGVILGTAGYMSPEQAKGHEADHRSDIFSVGCILYEMLSGRQAFEGDTASEILAGVLKSDADFSKLPPQLHPRLVELLRRCLEKNPKKRWHAAADVRVEVDSLIGRATAGAVPSLGVEGPWWRRAAPVAAGVALGALLAAPAAWRLKPDADAPIVRFSIALPANQNLTGSGRNLVAVSPDGRHLAYAADNRLFLRSLSAPEPSEIAGSSLGGVALNPVFSPDGESLAFWSQSDGTIKRIARTGGVAVTLCRAEAVWGMHWSEHGLVFGQGAGGIHRLAAGSSNAEVIAAVGDGEVASTPQLLDDGSGVVFAVKKEPQSWDTALIVLETIGGARVTLVEGGADPRLLPSGHLVFARAGHVLAVAFDARARRVSGAPVPVVEGVRRAARLPFFSVGVTGPTGAAQFSFSNTGVLAYLPGPADEGSEAAERFDLGIFDIKGAVRLLGLPKRNYQSPRVSRDGKFVAFAIEDQKDASVWVYEMSAGRAPQQLTLQGRNRFPVWSGEGRWLIFQSDRDGDRAIYRQPADGSGPAERLTKAEANEEHVPLSSSPDGSRVLFSIVKLRDSRLMVLSLADRRALPFGDVRAVERIDASFSPDGNWVAYQLRASVAGGRTVFVEPFPATGAKYPVGQGGQPYWSGAGDALILNLAPGVSHRLAFTAKPRVAFGPPETVMRSGRLESNPALAARNVDAMPNGQDVIGVARDAAASASEPVIHVVLNWFSDVTGRIAQR